jgi:two-component system, LytTR family, sensor kinase
MFKKMIEAIRITDNSKNRALLFGMFLWLVSMVFLLPTGEDREFLVFWGTVIPFAIFIGWRSYHYIMPAALSKKHPFWWFMSRIVVWFTFSALPLVGLSILVSRDNEAGGEMVFLNYFLQLSVTLPITYFFFRRSIKGNQELYTLKKELGRSTANFDFLRSQINPHFLFNALNTIYGTAIEEKAERTSEGIEKLGDMMRFMLQENMQEKISLAREIDYINNYISLQKLRTDINPAIKIEAQIDQPVIPVQIAPMLIIPFVENAFKHGISFRETSYIRITLEIKGNTVNFDVYNSRHPRPENDPEKNKSGIGLNNVKQRLKLLYPGKHELIIRQTVKDYFVHLTLQLS